MSRRGRRGRGAGSGPKPQGQNPHHQQDRSQQQRPQQKPQQNTAANDDSRMNGADKSGSAKGAQTIASVMTPRRQIHKKQMHQRNNSPATKKYRVVFFETLQAAKADLENLKNVASECDQLNIVVRAEATMDDSELNAVGKLFAGAAWALIHERRKQDGWYDATNE